MRIFLLRLLLGWWMIPIMYLFMIPFFYLLAGDFLKQVNEIKEICKMLWYGL